MSYCKKYNMHPSVALCLACEECYPPGERVNGRMCEYEEVDFNGDYMKEVTHMMNKRAFPRFVEAMNETLRKRLKKNFKATENPPEGLGPFAAVKGMDEPGNLAIVPKAEGRKHLTDEQFEKLLKHAKEFATSAVWGYDYELENDSDLRDYLQEFLIRPFIEPLINGEL